MAKKANILHLIGISSERSDRIIGGMTRLEMEQKSWMKFIKNSLELADNPAEINFVWYLIGSRVGMIESMKNIFNPPMPMPLFKTGEKEKNLDNPYIN